MAQSFNPENFSIWVEEVALIFVGGGLLYASQPSAGACPTARPTLFKDGGGSKLSPEEVGEHPPCPQEEIPL